MELNGTQEDQKYIVTLDSILPNLQQLNGYQPLLKYFWKEDLFENQDVRYFRLINHGRDMLPFIKQDAVQSINMILLLHIANFLTRVI